MITAQHDQIYHHLQKHISLRDEEWENIQSVLQERTVNRKEYLLKAGQPCTAIYYVNRGALRAFYQTPEGKEATIMFAIADWWITDMPCFVNQSAAMISIEAIEESKVLVLTKNDL